MAASARAADAPAPMPEAPAAVSPAIGQLDKAPKFALMIGVDAYGKGWPKRGNAVRDAKLVAGEFLRHGYRVAILENPDSQRLRRALKQFLLIDGDTSDARMFIWFSGHTHTIGGTSYLVPADAPLPRRESEFVKTAAPLDEYADLLRRAPAAQVYTVIDGPIAAIEFDARHTGQRQGAPHLPVRQFLSSAAVGQAAADDGSFRRLFLRALAGINRADSNLDKILTADEMGSYMVTRVAALTKGRQTPLYGRLPGSEFAGGDFAFRVTSSHRLDFLASSQGRDRLEEVREIEKVLWSAIQESEDPRKFEAFLKIYPDGAFAERAFARLNETKQPKRSAPTTVAALERAPAPLAMSVGAPQRKPNGPAKPPPSSAPKEVAQGVNPFDEPTFPTLPILSLGRQSSPEAPPPASSNSPPPAGPPPELVPITILKPIPLEPGGEMAEPVAPEPRPATAPPRTAPPPPRPIPASIPSQPPIPRDASPAGGRMVQIGAFRDRGTAERALEESRARAPSLFAGESKPLIQRADLGAKGIFYRARIGGLGDSRAAADFCAAFKRLGHDCFVVPLP